MGLFEKMGREVEKFKQNAQDAAEEHRQETEDDGDDGGENGGTDTEACPVCTEAIPADAAECPNCGTDLESYEDEPVDLPDDSEPVDLPENDATEK